MELAETTDFLQDLPKGPLDDYRKQATFNWKQMAITIEDEVSLRFKHKVWKAMENDPAFARSEMDLSLADYRKVTAERVFKIFDYNFLPEHEMLQNPRLTNSFTVALQQYDGSLATKRSILSDFFTNAVRGQGTSAHYKFIELAQKYKLLGCVTMTEIAHGSNTRALRTRATYDNSTQQFILHTPDFEAVKCWSGNLGKTATHAFVFAQLFTPDGHCHGLHSFIVPIRDAKTMLPFPGVMIGDMGPKIGLNGLDNGFLQFNNYSISRNALLNRTGNVTSEGQYVTPFKDPSRRFGASLGNLSAARAGMVSLCAAVMCSAMPIAIRYSAVRRQFSPSGSNEEIPVLEYQLQQWRLLPYLAATYVIKFLGQRLFDDFLTFLFAQFSADSNPEQLAMMSQEIHVLSCVAKPIAGWLARDTVQECREACGGHGYLQAAGLGRLRDDNDANPTHEGDNNVIIQQTSNWLLGIWINKATSDTKTPLGTLSFMSKRLPTQFQASSISHLLSSPEILLDSYKWLICWLLEITSSKLQSFQNKGKDTFTARSESQVYHARTLSLVFIEHYALETFWNKLCNKSGITSDIRNVLVKLMLLYGYWALEKHLVLLYQGAFISGPQSAQIIKDAILQLCTEVKNESVALVDAVAPPDFILNSVLGMSDGNVYKHLESVMVHGKDSFQRPSWWNFVSARLQSKL